MPRRGCRRAFPPRAPRLAVRDDFLHDRRSPASTGPPRGVPRRPADRRNRHAVKGRQRMKFSRVACSVVVAGLAATLPATHPVAAQEAPPAFGERVEVEVVNVDVVVTDASGRRITDLIREDFRLEVDGKVVPIDYFAPPGAPRPDAGAGHAGARDRGGRPVARQPVRLRRPERPRMADQQADPRGDQRLRPAAHRRQRAHHDRGVRRESPHPVAADRRPPADRGGVRRAREAARARQPGGRRAQPARARGA